MKKVEAKSIELAAKGKKRSYKRNFKLYLDVSIGENFVAQEDPVMESSGMDIE